MAGSERCLLIHGHFYQPPRENPWTGRIERQPSAAPWDDWNRRIADECYLPMARGRLRDEAGRVVDLYNNYARTSFNFGPTLISWLAERHPGLVRHLRDAAGIDRDFALAQAYSHMILPLADIRDRHTQIAWGLEEFRGRFGFFPEGMWLPECAVDPETVRALIDHGLRFVILSPHQASKARPFGESAWREASMGSIDSRRAYRLFEIDGGGRTHFERFLDVIFYTPGLNLKVSFDHILSRPEDLARELSAVFDSNCAEAQLASIVTDGEIYGHHEKNGADALARLFREILPAAGVRVVSAGGFIREHPPAWEVRLWNGEDGRGSSWSCEHGVGRWFRDCGCRPLAPAGWTQAWRGPLRDAFDAVRRRARETARRELGPLLLDVDDAVNDYIRVILDPSPAGRAAFLCRHVQGNLAPEAIAAIWRLLEALRNAMLMYTSCGWFFDEVSGLEPVQNMRYALRASELLQPRNREEPEETLAAGLSRARSNVPRFGDGGRAFLELAVPTRYSDREIVAGMAVSLACGFPIDHSPWKVARHPPIEWIGKTAAGSLVALDETLDRFLSASWRLRLDGGNGAAVEFSRFEEIPGDPFRDENAPVRIPAFGPAAEWEWGAAGRVEHSRLPAAVRDMLYRRAAGMEERELLDRTAELGGLILPFLDRAREHLAAAPAGLEAVALAGLERRAEGIVNAALRDMEFTREAADSLRKIFDRIRALWLVPDTAAHSRRLSRAARETLAWMHRLAVPGWPASLTPRTLPDGRRWLAPIAEANLPSACPEADDFSQSLGLGLAALRDRLPADGGGTGLRSLSFLPLPEILSFIAGAGLEPDGLALLQAEFWDFLDAPLKILVGGTDAWPADKAGGRLRQVGAALGFAPAAVERRLLAASER
ncbi:MAG: DUF3536 domain-containing protein [Planctomycetota bacterium]|jgi:hypothetical protein|nr:DUF3536 domain-containing protein [Planctomycetota bacterium]